MNDLMDVRIKDALRTVTPRPGFGPELLRILGSVRTLPTVAEVSRDYSYLRWVVAGAVGGAVGVAGAFLGVSRLNKRRVS